MADIDMQAIREAVARRQGGGASPIMSQVTAPGAALPTGGPNTPTMPIPASPPIPQAPQGPIAPQTPQAGQPQLKQVANFDDETRGLAKALINKLMGVL